MAAVVNSFAISGIDVYVVKIETDTIYGQPSVSIVGLGDASVKEAKESGSHFDLAMAIGLLIQSKQINALDIQNFGFIGELSLNADIRACSGVLPMTIEAKKRGITNLIVPKENIREASLVKGINIFGFEKLTEVVSFLEGVNPYSFLEDLKCDHIKIKRTMIQLSKLVGEPPHKEDIYQAQDKPITRGGRFRCEK